MSACQPSRAVGIWLQSRPGEHAGVPSIWQTTCKALRSSQEPDWDDAYDYRRPLQLLLVARYPWLASQDREDLVENVLLDIKQQLFARYLPDRGRFRSFLIGVVRNRLRQLCQKRNKEPQPVEFLNSPAIEAEDAETVDLVAEVLGSTRAWCAQQQDARQVAILAERLLQGHKLREIAASLQLPLSSVQRLLQQAREEIVALLLERTLRAYAPGARSLHWKRLADIALQVFADPRSQREQLAAISCEKTREGLELWLATYRKLLASLPARQSAEGLDLVRGLERILAASLEPA